VFSDPLLSGPTPIQLKFSPDGAMVTYLRPTEGDQEILDLWAYDIASGERRALVRAENLIPGDEVELSEAEAARKERMRIRQRGIVEYAWSKGGDRLLFPLGGALYVYDMRLSPADRVGCAVPASDSPVLDPKFAPDGKQIAFVRDGNLWVVAAQGGAERQLTRDGSGAVQNGIAEFVAQEEMSRYTGFWWSPDGKAIAYTQIDESQVPLVQRPAYHADRVEVVEQRYPAAGQTNAVVRVGVVQVDDGTTTWMDTGVEVDVYIARVGWLPDASAVAVQVQSRDQRTLDLLFADARTGASRQILREQDAHWVELHDDLRILKDRSGFVWSSHRTGYKQLFLYDMAGTLVRQLTGPKGSVGKVCGIVDADAVIYLGWADSPLEQHLYRVRLEGCAAVQITAQPGWHDVSLAAEGGHYVDTHSDTVHAPQVHLHALDGRRVATLEANELPERDEYGWARSEYVTLEAADGATLHGRLTRPPGCDPEQSYPTVVLVYGGPHAQKVRDAWDASLTVQLFAQQGFVVFELDNRGTGNRGHAFASALHEHMGTVEVEDQLAGVAYLKALRCVDPERIGIYGWSYGGYMTLMCMARAPDVFRAGVSVAPVTDWRLYDTHYTERYMGHPDANAAGYEDSSVLAHIERLGGRLLLVHGMADDNVLFQHSVMLMDRLQQARIPFEMMAYPGKKHGIAGKATRIHLFEMMLAHFRRWLS
jgi:dipeptidyl-peptidase-4